MTRTYKEMAVIHEYNKKRDIPTYCSYVCFLKNGASVKNLKRTLFSKGFHALVSET